MIRTTPNPPVHQMYRPSAVARPLLPYAVQRMDRSEAILFLLMVAALGGVLSHYSRTLGALVEHLPTMPAQVVDLVLEMA